MRRLIIPFLPLLVCFSTCAKPTPRDLKCELPQEAPMRLDLADPPLFIIGLILFWIAAALRYRSAKRDAEFEGDYLSIRPSAD
jgi:hypothetical protein